MTDDIEGEFSMLRTFILHDLQVMTRLDEGTNYAAVLAAMSGCDALGSVRYGREHSGAKFFGEYILPERWRPLGDDLWNAVRNGLAHSYETKSLLRIGETAVEIAISWREKPHLQYDAASRQLFINVRALVEALGEAVARYERELSAHSSFRDNFRRGRRKSLDVRVPPIRQQLWQQALQESEAG